MRPRPSPCSGAASRWVASSRARLGDRFDHAWFAAICSIAASVALVAAVAVPSLEASIVLFGVVGFAFGPVYPLIMAVAGDRYPARSAAVSGFLSGVAVIGAIVYPPVMGFVSVGAGLGAAMLGAAGLVLACGLVLVAVARRPAAGFRGGSDMSQLYASRKMRYVSSASLRQTYMQSQK